MNISSSGSARKGCNSIACCGIGGKAAIAWRSISTCSARLASTLGEEASLCNCNCSSHFRHFFRKISCVSSYDQSSLSLRKAYSWVTFTFLDEGEKIDGKTCQVNTDSGFSSPHVHFHYSTAVGSQETEMFMKDYAMRLEFGEMSNGKLPEKIYLCLPDSNKSVLRGTFTASDISTSLR